MAEGYSTPRRAPRKYGTSRERSQSIGVVSFLKPADKKREREADMFDSIAVPFEKVELCSPTRLATKPSKLLLNFTRSSNKYSPILESLRELERKTLIDITVLRRKKGGVFPIPLELDVKCKQDCIPIVYDPGYNIETTKPQLPLPPQTMLLNKCAQVFTMSKADQYQSVKAADIAAFYDISKYVSAPIRQLEVAKIAEMISLKFFKKTIPVTWKEFSSVVLRPLRHQMMGSVLACQLALGKGWAINIGGGFSHHTTNTGGGLGLYDDVLVCLAIISNLPEVEHIMVVNADAYQSPSYKYAQNINCPVTVVDIYSDPVPETYYPGESTIPSPHVQYHDCKIIDFDAPTSCAYRTIHEVTRLFDEDDFIRPSLCIYVAGTTVLAENPHTKMQFTVKHLLKRDEGLFRAMRGSRVPIAFLMGSGYQPYDVEASAAVIELLLTQHCGLTGKRTGHTKKTSGAK